MVMDWFNAGEAREFGRNLANMYAAEYSNIDQKKEKAGTVKKRAKLLVKLEQEAKQFGRTHRLNIYKKAKLGNMFKWTLLEKGFDKEFADKLTREVVLALK